VQQHKWRLVRVHVEIGHHRPTGRSPYRM
jgi:hypothetical protein